MHQFLIILTNEECLPNSKSIGVFGLRQNCQWGFKAYGIK